MITKSYSKAGRTCRVTFKIPAGQAEARSAVVLGEFNGWNADATPMKRGKDGSWSATVTVETGRPYRFRYLLDGTQWANDDAADALVPNQFGSKDSILSLDEAVQTEARVEKAGKAQKKTARAPKSAEPVKPAKAAKAAKVAKTGKTAKAPAKTAKAPRAGKRSEPREH